MEIKMKKLYISIICFVLCICSCFNIYAAEKGEKDIEPSPAAEVTVDASQPRLMVTSYETESSGIMPDKKSKVKITFKNYSKTKAVKNIKLSLSEESGSIKCVDMPTKYVDSIGAGKTYTWETVLTASKTAQIGEYAITVASEYEDSSYNAYSSSDIITITVKQTVSLDFDGAKLPLKVVQDDTQTLEINLMNTGKTDLRNCRIDFDIEGLESGGTTFVGEIPAGENKTGSSNLRVSSDVVGDVKGKITIKYDDVYGKSYKKTAEVSTKIEKKVIKGQSQSEEKEEEKYKLWWLFLIIGASAGGGIGCAVPIAINSKKQRKKDEMML